MASPIGHTCAALALGPLGARYATDWRWLLFAVVSACAADLDFVPGLLVGDMNRWHQLASHSFLAALAWGAVTWWVLRGRVAEAGRLGLAAGLIYTSHLLIDFFTLDKRAPHGIPLFWPADVYFMSPVSLFGGIRHGVPGDDLYTVFWSIFSWHNLSAIGREVALVLPLFVLVYVVTRRGRLSRVDNSQRSP